MSDQPAPVPIISGVDLFDLWYRSWPRLTGFDVNAAGLFSPTGTYFPLPPRLGYSITATAGNGIAETVEQHGQGPGLVDFLDHTPSGSPGMWDRPMILNARMLERVRNAGLLGVQSGVELGSYAVTPSYPLGSTVQAFAVLATRNVVRLFAAEPAAGINAWVLEVNTTKAPAHQTRVNLVGVNPPGIVDRPHRLNIVYEPENFVAAMIDGVEGARITVSLDLPESGRAERFGYGMFICSPPTASTIESWFLGHVLFTMGIE